MKSSKLQSPASNLKGPDAPALAKPEPARPWQGALPGILPGGFLGRLRLAAGAWSAPLGLGLVTLLVFWGDLFNSLAYYGSDTLSFYYPLTTWYAAQLRSGQLPIWLPYIFGGYPLFADGEIGMLYPLNLIAFGLLPSDTAFIWLRPLHFWLAGLFTYWLGSLLGLSRLGALIAGLTFSYGSFLVGHLEHENLVRSTVWLPLVLGLFELALRAKGSSRLGWLCCCGAVLGVQMLGLHLQPVLLTLITLGCYALVGPLLGGWEGRRSFLRYLSERVLLVALVLSIGLGLAAVQLLPLYQLGERSVRAGEVSYDFSTTYSVPPIQLVQLLLPYIFRPNQASYWGLWSPAETTLYLGIAPLLLALVSLAYLRSRPAAFFGALGGLSLLLSIGDYLPIKLYSLIWSIPGFSYMRVPARFSLLFVLGGAMLAGLGADWLASRTFERRALHGQRPRVRRLALLILGFSLSALAVFALFILARAWLEQDPTGARRAIDTYYLSLRRGDWRLSSSAVYFGLLNSLDVGNPRTWGALMLMVCVSAWLLLRALHYAPGRLWQTGLLVLVSVDLVIFAQGFYSRRPVEDLKLSSPAVQFLSQHNALHRVFVEPILYNRLGPNQLVPWTIDLAGGYSSLEPRRATEYFWSIVRQDNALLDLYNVRYVVSPRQVPGLLSFEGTLFHPADRLLRGSRDNPSGAETFQFQPWWTRALTVVAAGERLRDVPYGQALAEITIRGPTGERRLVLRSGHHLEDGAAPRLGPSLPGAHFEPMVTWAGPSFRNPHQLSVLYGSTLLLEEPLLATSLTIQTVRPDLAVEVHGLGLHDRIGLPVRSLMPSDRSKYRLVYGDEDVDVFENTAVVPRAFVVGSVQTVPVVDSPAGPASDAGQVIEQMLLGKFDPRRTVLIDGEASLASSPGTDRAPIGSAEVVEYRGERVALHVDASAPGYVVLNDRYDDNWRAQVDDRDAPLLRANAMFRAVPVEAGSHEVVFSYEPATVRVGAAISLVSLTLLGLIGLRAFRRSSR